ncbi:MAG: hypothetical protein EZS28_015028 [Streblomastix strix]|uniref:NrS-1 polymerase-like helicase domain-containing protein n=1 Tax=Streblomastix strix TaxID=222440 RepID=A0A5J4W3T9_9EUKA|nr:MAG: hypothetical protein EZS28_015028 [Streblomastix strix]
MSSQDSTSVETISIESINIKDISLEKGSKRKYTRKSKTDDKAKELMDKLIEKQELARIKREQDEFDAQKKEAEEQQFTRNLLESIAQEKLKEQKNQEQQIEMDYTDVSFLSIFSGIYGITNEQKRAQGLGNIRKFNKLTANAEKNYGKAAFSGERQSSKNIIDIDDFVGKFNTAIENKMLSIANERKNFGKSRMSNMDALKSIIIESSFEINEKYGPKHEIEKVVNIIIFTNNIFPLNVKNSDRRYVIYKWNSVHREDLNNLTNLCNSFDEGNIPMTQAKKNIIKASISPVDDVIISHFKSFSDGVTCNIIEGWKPQEMQSKNYQIVIKNICEKVRKSSDGERKWMYQLKEEMISIYENLPDEEAYEIKEQVEQEIQNDGNEYI